jgi:hypothetical protein
MTKTDISATTRKFPTFSSSANKLILFLSCLAMSATSVNADVVMKCGETLYKYDETFFGDDQIEVRWDGVWQTWCGDGRLELKDYSATCWPLDGATEKEFKSQSAPENPTDFDLKSAIDYAYTYCKCGLDGTNRDCFAKNGVQNWMLDLPVEILRANHDLISSSFCPMAESMLLADAHDYLRKNEASVRAMFRMSPTFHSLRIREGGHYKIDFVAHLLKSNTLTSYTLTTACEAVDP